MSFALMLGIVLLLALLVGGLFFLCWHIQQIAAHTVRPPDAQKLSQLAESEQQVRRLQRELDEQLQDWRRTQSTRLHILEEERDLLSHRRK